MGHDVYVCYDDEDKEIAEDVYSALKDKRLDCWIKSRDVSHDVVEEMMRALNESDVMVLIYSAKTKASNFVNTEVDMAFSNNIPIMVFRIDDSPIDGALEFFLSSQPKFDAYKNPDAEFERLINTTYDLVRETRRKNFGDSVREKKIPIIIGAAVILIVAACIFMFVPLDDINNGGESVQVNASNVTVEVTDFHMEDVSKKGYSWNYSYFVGGTISPMIPAGSKYVITSDFYDKSGNLINSTQTPVDDLQIVDDGFLFGSTVSDTKDIARVEVQLLTSKDIVVDFDDSQLKNNK